MRRSHRARCTGKYRRPGRASRGRSSTSEWSPGPPSTRLAGAPLVRSVSPSASSSELGHTPAHPEQFTGGVCRGRGCKWSATQVIRPAATEGAWPTLPMSAVPQGEAQVKTGGCLACLKGRAAGKRPEGQKLNSAADKFRPRPPRDGWGRASRTETNGAYSRKRDRLA